MCVEKEKYRRGDTHIAIFSQLLVQLLKSDLAGNSSCQDILNALYRFWASTEYENIVKYLVKHIFVTHNWIKMSYSEMNYLHNEDT